jgi:hypothetical protein
VGGNHPPATIMAIPMRMGVFQSPTIKARLFSDKGPNVPCRPGQPASRDRWRFWQRTTGKIL